ncbi:NB-ARC domain-containing protein [Robiginitalea sediminis]|uniref:NB-ARC domain-containing protein n=1 Tax=Robiginitalea sediminis TaxID=1982593 RepID=UPI000B4BE603|nr:ATP-binding protein [Robiginitalea sediminis]
MEFIRQNIARKIKFLTLSGNIEELRTVYQSYFEYLMTYTLGYLWQKNFEKLDSETKEYIIGLIQKPSIGDIENACRKLDMNKEIFVDKSLSRKFSNYPNFRNERFGHGYTYSDETTSLVDRLKEFCSVITSNNHPIFSAEIDLIRVEGIKDGWFYGTSFKCNGADYLPWKHKAEGNSFELKNVYGYYSGNQYFRISPFVEIIDENSFFIFSSIKEPLTGKAKYNRLLKTEIRYLENEIFCEIDIEGDENKKKTINGTIINHYKPNYNKFIENTVKENVQRFLSKGKHSVTATIWGHGGVGKTATIQKVCEELSKSSYRVFDYIVFTTAKDRFYNYLTGHIEHLDERVNSYEELIKTINLITNNSPDFDPDSVVNLNHRLLIVIDDFETFPEEEKNRIISFIKRLDVNRHRVIITTRANIVIGEEILSNELDENETFEFLKQAYNNEVDSSTPFDIFLDEFNIDDIKRKVHDITNGRPLFIYQLSYIIAQKGSLSDALKVEIKSSSQAVSFLYGRIFDYLTPLAQKIFTTIGLLVDENDLGNVIKKIAYILNYEDKQEEFKDSIDELIKLKVIEIKEDGFFYVYSKEILPIMRLKFDELPHNEKGNRNKRLLQISRDKKLDTEQALLQNANKNRYSKNEEEVISSYKQILNRQSSPQEIRIQAILNLASYLVLDRGKKETAIQYLEEYYPKFKSDGQFIKMISSYYWSMGNRSFKDKSIRILADYATTNIDLSKEINLELLGLLVTYKSIYTIDLKEELKTDLNFGDITRQEFSRKNESIKQDLKNILQHHGNRLFNYVSSIKLENISSGSRQNIITAFYQLTEIFVRLNQYDRAKEVCQMALERFPTNHHRLFNSKLNRINSYDYSSKKNSSNYRERNKRLTEFGSKLKDAISNRKKN